MYSPVHYNVAWLGGQYSSIQKLDEFVYMKCRREMWRLPVVMIGKLNTLRKEH